MPDTTKRSLDPTLPVTKGKIDKKVITGNYDVLLYVRSLTVSLNGFIIIVEHKYKVSPSWHTNIQFFKKCMTPSDSKNTFKEVMSFTTRLVLQLTSTR